MRRTLTALLLCLLVQPAFAADKWLSIRSKNVLLVGNAKEADIRKVGRYFEEFRSTLGTLFPKVAQSPSTPTTILVFKDDNSMKPFKPGAGSAFFHGGEDINFILATPALTSMNNALHDYTHSILQDVAESVPVWAAEGLAECLSTFIAGNKQNEYILGQVSDAHIATIAKTPLLSLKILFSQDRGSPHYNETSRQNIMYAQSWALMHYFLLGPNGKRRPQLAEFLTLLSSATPLDDAFTEAFETDYSTLDDEFREYIRHPWPNQRIVSNGDLQVDVKAIPTRTLTESEAEFYLGDLLLHTNRLPDAEAHLKTSLAKDPNQSASLAAMGMLRLRQKNETEARSLLQKAIEVDPTNFLISYYYASLLQNVDRTTMRAQLNKSIEAAPRFAPAYGLLASANLAAGENLTETEVLLKKALQIAPGREQFRFMLAQTYLKLNRTADGMAMLTTLQRVTSDPKLKQTATTMLDELAPTQPVFTEIRPDAPPEPRESPQPAPVPSVPQPLPTRQPGARETVLEAIVPIGPSVQGEKVSGVLTFLECGNGLTLRIRTEKTTLELHSSNPGEIQFLSYTSNVSNNVQCGPQNPPAAVSVTYRPINGGFGEPLVVEFLEATK
jgi:tetratricopeptide (TPR) repeat protein